MPHSATAPTRESRTPSQETIVLDSPPTPPRSRRPSLSNTMHWLSRSSTTPYSPSKPTRISEPKLVRSIELLAQPRSGLLGSGATIVRTPDEALRETGVRLTFDGKAQKSAHIRPQSSGKAHQRNSAASEKHTRSESIASEDTPTLTSPPLPPLPLPGDEESEFLNDVDESEFSKVPPRPLRALPPTPSLRPSLKSPKVVQPFEDGSSIPPLPSHISTFPEPPPFRPILVSEVPIDATDASKIIITLETSTATHNTTLETLQSRTSHLSKYLSLLLPSHRTSTASSVYSTESRDDLSTFRHHLTSQGLLPQKCFRIHIFLDRPSSPYSHILNYLRMPLGSPETPETLPRSVQMYTSSHLRLEALLELRDEASYLNLEGLHKLCLDEIRLRHGPRLHSRGQSTSTVVSAHSMHASICSLHTLLEKVDVDARSNPRDSTSSDSKSSKGSTSDTMVSRTPPTPRSWNGHSRGRSESRSGTVARSPPAGWI